VKIYLDCPTDFLDLKTSNYIKKFDITKNKQKAECVIVNPGIDCFLSKKYFTEYPKINVVGTPSTGTNHLDLNCLDHRDIQVYSLLDDRPSLKNIHASAEFTWIHIMNSFRKFDVALKQIDQWRESQNEKFLRSNELCGKNLGIIGHGRIGSKVAKYANTFGMNVYYFDPKVSDSEFAIKVKSIEGLNHCDAISINVVLNSETNGMIKSDVFKNFEDGLKLINTSRGEIMDEDYVIELIKNRNFLYSCDVLKNEQNIDRLKESKIFIESKTNHNIIVTPHVAGATMESQTKALIAILKLCTKR